jgi:hypothetical protein
MTFSDGGFPLSGEEKTCQNALFLFEHFTKVDLWWTPEPFIRASSEGAKSLQIQEADARTRTGGPSLRVMGVSHSGSAGVASGALLGRSLWTRGDPR